MLTVVQVFAAIGVIALVLLQRGRGADAGAGFGAGASATVFGARGATTGLSRATAVLAAVFMLNSLALAYLGSRAPAAQSQGLLESGSSSTTGVVTPAPAAAPELPAGSAEAPDAAPAESAPAP
ncbi:MAG: preprotein translocase subunit SecG [Steroidobacteraceae bacterium]